MCQGLDEINDEYLGRLHSQLQDLILSGGENNMRSLNAMDKVGESDTQEQLTTEEERFKAICFATGG